MSKKFVDGGLVMFTVPIRISEKANDDVIFHLQMGQVVDICNNAMTIMVDDDIQEDDPLLWEDARKAIVDVKDLFITGVNEEIYHPEDVTKMLGMVDRFLTDPDRFVYEVPELA